MGSKVGSLRERYENGRSFEAFLEHARANVEMWNAMAARAQVPDDVLRDVEAIGGTWHLLVLAEDWCGDAINTLPVLGALAGRASNLDLRILPRDENPDLMNAHLTGTSRSVPVVILLDANYVERAWWGPRPTPLQGWVIDTGRGLTKEDRYREIRRWYARDRGATTLAEVVAALRSVDASRAA
jgi:thioredoxin family protein